MSKFCVICGKLLTGQQRKLCSEECRSERAKEYSYEYRQNNQERIKEYQQEYYQINQEILKEYQREYCQNNPEKIKERSSKYCQDNPEKMKEYYQNNTEKMNEYSRKRYRRVRGLSEDVDLHKESSIEKIIREWLQENDIEFTAQYYINFENSTWTHVDFFIEPNICLYVDGNYYHLLPNAKRCDIEQNKILPQMGYDVIRINEFDILEGKRPWGLINE